MSSKKQTRRKLQFAGNSSYVLTLPKAWVVSQGLAHESSEVMIQELNDSTLRITPTDMGKTDDKLESYTILVDKKSKTDEIIRKILAAYLASKNQIIIKSKNDAKIIPPDMVLTITDIIGKLWGSEITAETSNQIVVQDALDPSSMSIDDIIAKAWFTAQNMLDQTFMALFENKESSKKVVENSENTLDKLYYLALRQLYKASSNYIFASEIGIKPKDIIDYHLITKDIERVGDHCVSMVESFGYPLENKEILEELASLIKESTNFAIDAFRKLDHQAANEAIKIRKIVWKKASKVEFSIHELPIARSILRIADYSTDIGELVINRIVAEENKKKLTN